MTDKVIVVVGAGASCVSYVEALLAEVPTCKPGLRFTIYIIERRRRFGRGLAYEQDLDSNILNTKASFITPFSNRPGHFHDWALANRDAWEEEFPGYRLEPDSYVPRPLFGLYLEAMVDELVRDAIALGCHVIPVHAEATSIKYGHDGRLIVSTDSSLAFQADHVVLSCGNLPSLEHKSLAGTPNFFSSPYPVRKLPKKIAPDAVVGILGAHLSAIDAIVGLTSRGHAGQIGAHSRSGFLPFVRGTQGRYQPRTLTRAMVEDYVREKGTIRLRTFASWVIDEMRAAGEDVSAIDWQAPMPPRDPEAFYEREISAARRPRLWQAVLYSTNAIVDLVWHHLDVTDRREFWNYRSAWMAHRVSIPVENAERLLRLLKTGQLAFLTGHTRVSPTSGGIEISVEGRTGSATYAYAAVIAATGAPLDARMVDSSLVQSLIACGMARPHPYGGLEIDAESGFLRNRSGQPDSRLTVIGDLTSGTYFFTSALEINARQAGESARQTVRRTREGDGPLREESAIERLA